MGAKEDHEVMSSFQGSILRRALPLLVLALAVTVVSCGGAGGGSSAITGRVFDSVTGAPIAGASVVCGGQTVTTDSSGKYRVEGSGSKTGMFAVWKGQSYRFLVVTPVTVDLSGNPVCDVSMVPNSTASYTRYTISGNLPAALAAAGSIYMRIHNANGGYSDGSAVLSSGATTYTLQVSTSGTNCLAWVVLDDGVAAEPINFYVEGVSIGGGTNTLNLSAPTTQNVTVNGGVNGQMFPSPMLMTTTWGPVAFLGGLSPFSGTSKVVQMANPSAYPLIWSNMNTVGSFMRGAFSARTSPSASVTLPALPTGSDPGSAGGPMIWSHSSATLSFSAVFGATGYFISAQDSARNMGMIITTDTVLELPFGLSTDTLDPSGTADWDATLIPTWFSSSDLSILLPVLKTLGNNGPQGLESFQFSQSVSGTTTNGIFP